MTIIFCRSLCSVTDPAECRRVKLFQPFLGGI